MKYLNYFILILFCSFPLQMFSAEIIAGSLYKISTTYTGNRVLTTENSSLGDNEAVFVWTETGVNSQRWRVVDAGGGMFYLENAYSGKRLQAQTQTKIVQNGIGTTDAFKWSFEKAENSNDSYYIYNAQRTGCVEVLGSTANLDGASLRFNIKNETANPLQIWKIEQVEDTPNKLTPDMRVSMMQAWKDRYFNWLKTSTGFWGEAECMEIILDAYETTGKEEYKTMFEEVYEHFVSYPAGWGQSGNGTDWMWNDFNDDVAWAVLASIRAHFMFGQHPNSSINYLNIARTNFNKMYTRALYKVDNLYYVLRWKQGQEGTTSCVNGPSEIAACYLGIATGDDTYFQKAKMLYDSQRIHMYEPSTGRVYDSFENNWASAYNQGTYLGAALMLYNRYGDEMYRKDAEKIMEFTRNNLCNSEGIITSVDSESGDYTSFKAILLRYVRRYVADLGNVETGEWLQKNALKAFNNRNSRGITRLEWKTKTAETDDWNEIGAFAAVAIAMNAPMDVNTIYKKAFDPIKSGSFDYISKLTSENNTEGEVMEITAIEDGAYLGYNLVDCGNDFATGIKITLLNDNSARTVDVRVGSSTGELLASVAIPASNSTWMELQANFSRQLTGVNNLYLVFKGSKNNLRFKSFRLISGGTNYSSVAQSDITDDGGELTSLYAGGELTKLTDNAIETKYVVSGQSDVWVQYKAKARYKIASYSITSANDNPECDPKDWTLYGSDNGTDWTVLDERKGRSFGAREATLHFTVNSEEPWQYFKLHIRSNNGGSDTQLSEWQLFGDTYFESYSHDFIEEGSLLSEGVETTVLHAIRDNNPETFFSAALSEFPIAIIYEAPVPIMLQGFALTSSGEDSASDPKSWRLSGSTDGISWRVVDSRDDQFFESRYQKKLFDRTTSTAYQYFKLEIMAVNDMNAADVKIAEWELYGYYLNNFDVSYNPNGKITAQWEGKSADENYLKLIDKNKAGKYLASYRKSFWTIYESERPVKLYAYSLISANDAPNRDPKNWTLYGSNNNSSWTVIDKRENQNFIYRQSTQYYSCVTNKTYKYFKLDVESNHDEKNIQLAEWQLFGEFNTYGSDITENGGVLTSSHAATDGTELSNLTDNNETSKYYLDITNANFGDGIWFKYESPEPIVLSSYALTSSNDIPFNDPKAWKLQGSNDDFEWTDIDLQPDVTFERRCERKVFQTSASVAYKYFRLFVTARKSTIRGFQFAEWELFGTIVSGVDDIAIQQATIYPNPAVDAITVQTPTKGVLEINSMTGETLLSTAILEGNNTIQLGRLPQGFYLLKIKSKDFVKSEILIKK